MNRGHLVVSDGAFRDRRERRLHRATSGLKRVVLLGHTGYLTLDALRWIRDVGAALVQIDIDGHLVSAISPNGPSLASLRRSQAMAHATGAAVSISREILTSKVVGQLALARSFNCSAHTGDEIERALQEIEAANAVVDMVAAEASAAAAYWRAWESVVADFGPANSKVPAHWRQFGQRHSPITRSSRLAANPANAILNYLYALAEAEATVACETVGLDASVGFFHADKNGRSSLALDVMEAVRPSVDAYVLALLAERVLNPGDFTENRRGVCRVGASLTTKLAATGPSWAREIAPVAESVAQVLSNYGDGAALATPLTQATRRSAWDERRRAPSRPVGRLHLPHVCDRCGGDLASRSRRRCDHCLREQTLSAGERARPEAQRVLAELRAEGRDPAHGGHAARARGRKNAAHQRENLQWNAGSQGSIDPHEFAATILPGLRRRKPAELAERTGLSVHYCALIRLGKRIPHPRHWDALRDLVGQNVSAT